MVVGKYKHEGHHSQYNAIHENSVAPAEINEFKANRFPEEKQIPHNR